MIFLLRLWRFFREQTSNQPPASVFTLATGTLLAGEVLVVGTSDMATIADNCECCAYQLEAFSFNGDDALVIELDGVVTDVFGEVAVRPSGSWNVGGVDTRNNNLELKSGITTSDVDGWVDPSIRFNEIARRY